MLPPTIRIDSREATLLSQLLSAEEKEYRERFKEATATAAALTYPNLRFSKRGIVICGGGVRYFTCAWVCINILRKLGCNLPIQLWHLGQAEMTQEMRNFIEPLGVETVDAYILRRDFPARILNGWELKPYAIIYCPFEEVLSMDADNICVKNPEYLFSIREFVETGAVFWPDFSHLKPTNPIWAICDIPYQDEPEFETGQILVNKSICWGALNLTMFMNEHSDFYYWYIHGDKETFHMAFKRLGQTYAMPSRRILPLPGTMCQHDFSGERIFQHRNMAKWNLFEPINRISDFWLEKGCYKSLAVLQFLWTPGEKVPRYIHKCKELKELSIAKELIGPDWRYSRIGYDERLMSFLDTGLIGKGMAVNEVFWDVIDEDGMVVCHISSLIEITCRLTLCDDGVWRGKWIDWEQMPIEISKADAWKPTRSSSVIQSEVKRVVT